MPMKKSERGHAKRARQSKKQTWFVNREYAYDDYEAKHHEIHPVAKAYAVRIVMGFGSDEGTVLGFDSEDLATLAQIERGDPVNELCKALRRVSGVRWNPISTAVGGKKFECYVLRKVGRKKRVVTKTYNGVEVSPTRD